MNVMNLIQVGFDCLSHLDTNVKVGYECYELIQVWFDCSSHLDICVKVGYECYEFHIGWV